jgi:hypothetical protein
MIRNRILNRMGDALDRKYKNHLKAGSNGIAQDCMNTGMRQRIIGRLANACFGRI